MLEKSEISLSCAALMPDLVPPPASALRPCSMTVARESKRQLEGVDVDDVEEAATSNCRRAADDDENGASKSARSSSVDARTRKGRAAGPQGTRKAARPGLRSNVSASRQRARARRPEARASESDGGCGWASRASLPSSGHWGPCRITCRWEAS
jgi:hypothetical protein